MLIFLQEKREIKIIFNITLLLLVLFISFSCLTNNDKKISEILKKEKPSQKTHLDKILERGVIVAVTNYNSMSYFIYRGEPMGYEFEKLKIFAEYLDVDLEMRINNNIYDAFAGLDNGEYDLMAMGLTITKERTKLVDFTIPHLQTRQVLVQRMPENWRKMKTWDEIEMHLIRNPLELAGKTINIQKGTIFYTRLENLSDEIGSPINIIEDPDREVEQLIEAVAKGEIDYTIADEHVAMVNEKYFKNIDVKTAVSFPQNLAWAVKKGSDSLLSVMNDWLIDFNKSLTSKYIYNKYFKNPRSVYIAKSEYHSLKGGNISKYDDIIRQISEKYDLDWRLLASLIYQESQFQPDVKSWAGAWGLMQLMPGTAASYGVDTTSSAEEQIEAGVLFMNSLNKQLPEEIDDPEERMKFVLASYNVGIAHIYDARRLAEKHGKDQNVWSENVDYYILKKSDPKYYRDPVVRYGYARGEETYNFVIEILDRYKHYKNVIKN